MRAHLPVLLLAISLPACEDAMGPAGDCSAEMREVRREYGAPHDLRFSENDGERTTTWMYGPQEGKEAAIIEFRWGPRLDSCQVSIR